LGEITFLAIQLPLMHPLLWILLLLAGKIRLRHLVLLCDKDQYVSMVGILIDNAGIKEKWEK
tara:strand:- start:2 stop:187 length:186 start_codon:yes stop_codon:yes gene_type:complete